jgi:opacity protein-like surface antigen
MNKKFSRIIAEGMLAASVLLALPFSASAQVGELGDKVFSIGPRVTYFESKDADDGSFSGGVQARLRFTPVLGVEGSVDYRKDDYSDGVSIKTYPVQVSLLAYFMPDLPVSPYLLGGTGWYFTQVKGPMVETDTENRFGLHAGGGLEFMLNDSLSLDGSYRYIWMEDITSHDENALDKTYDDSGSMVTLALNFLF